MPVDENEVGTENTADFDAAFAAKAEEVEKATEAKDPGAVGEESTSNADEFVFDNSFTDAAVNTAASKGEDGKDDIVDKLAALEAENNRLRQSEKSQRGRVSALTKKLVEQRASGATPKVQSLPQEGSGNTRDWETFREEFPEMASIVDQRIASVDSRLNNVTEVVNQVATTTDSIIEKEVKAYRELQLETLADRHPDFEQIKVSQEFQKWKEEAPEDIKAKVKSHHAEDAISVLDAYKAATGRNTTPPGKSEVEILNERRAAALRQSAGISSKPVGHTARQETSSGDDDFDAAFAESASRKENERAIRY